MRKKIIRANSILFMSFLTFFISLKNVKAQNILTEKNEIRVSVSDAFPLTLSNAFTSGIISALDVAIGGGKGYELNCTTF